MSNEELDLLNEMKENCLKKGQYIDEKAKDKFNMLCHCEDFIIENYEQSKEIERLNNIINELEKYIEESYKYNSKCLSTIFEARAFEDNKILDKLQELKGDGSNEL